MKNKMLILLGITLVLCLIPTTTAFAKTVKAKSVSVSPKTVVLAVGDIAQLTATKNPKNASGKLTWTSSDKSIATVSNKGVAQGVAEGTATITVKTSNKKTAECNVIVRDYATKADLTDTLIKQLSPTFVTKEELKQDFYSKSEIDAKLKALPSGGGSSCGCTVKTNTDVVNILKENTYTKEEIDSKLSGNDWEGSVSLTCINANTLPKTFKYTEHVYNGGDGYDEYTIKITINKNISCTKSRVMDYIDDVYSEEYYLYKYDYKIFYNIEGFNEYRQAKLASSDPDDIEIPCVVISYGGNDNNCAFEEDLDPTKTEKTFTRYSDSNINEFFVKGARMYL